MEIQMKERSGQEMLSVILNVVQCRKFHADTFPNGRWTAKGRCRVERSTS